MLELDSLSEVEILENIEYGDHDCQKLDLYKNVSNKPSPLVFWFHGGEFSQGSKDEITRTEPLNLMLNAGLSVAVPNYRLTYHARFPAAMQDGMRAVQFGKYHAAEWNIDPDNVAVAGSSAGGMVALWIAFHDEFADPDSADPVARISTCVQAVAGYNTQSTIDPRVLPGLIGRDEPVLLDFLGLSADECDTPKAYALYDQASPVTHVHQGIPPVFLCYGGELLPIDSDLSHSERIHHPVFGKYLKDKMDPLGIECEWHYIGEDSSGLSLQDFFGKMVGFFTRHLLLKQP